MWFYAVQMATAEPSIVFWPFFETPQGDVRSNSLPEVLVSLS